MQHNAAVLYSRWRIGEGFPRARVQATAPARTRRAARPWRRPSACRPPSGARARRRACRLQAPRRAVPSNTNHMLRHGGPRAFVGVGPDTLGSAARPWTPPTECRMRTSAGTGASELPRHHHHHRRHQHPCPMPSFFRRKSSASAPLPAAGSPPPRADPRSTTGPSVLASAPVASVAAPAPGSARPPAPAARSRPYPPAAKHSHPASSSRLRSDSSGSIRDFIQDVGSRARDGLTGVARRSSVDRHCASAARAYDNRTPQPSAPCAPSPLDNTRPLFASKGSSHHIAPRPSTVTPISSAVSSSQAPWSSQPLNFQDAMDTHFPLYTPYSQPMTPHAFPSSALTAAPSPDENTKPNHPPPVMRKWHRPRRPSLEGLIKIARNPSLRATGRRAQTVRSSPPECNYQPRPVHPSTFPLAAHNGLPVHLPLNAKSAAKSGGILPLRATASRPHTADVDLIGADPFAPLVLSPRNSTTTPINDTRKSHPDNHDMALSKSSSSSGRGASAPSTHSHASTKLSMMTAPDFPNATLPNFGTRRPNFPEDHEVKPGYRSEKRPVGGPKASNTSPSFPPPALSSRTRQRTTAHAFKGKIAHAPQGSQDSSVAESSLTSGTSCVGSTKDVLASSESILTTSPATAPRHLGLGILHVDMSATVAPSPQKEIETLPSLSLPQDLSAHEREKVWLSSRPNTETQATPIPSKYSTRPSPRTTHENLNKLYDPDGFPCSDRTVAVSGQEILPLNTSPARRAPHLTTSVFDFGPEFSEFMRQQFD